jgi:RNA polymerase sigma-70 factor (ECF subfamily)
MTEDRLTTLYKTYGPAIYIRCRSILSDEAEAHDATQETFVRVYRHLSEVPSDREALYWIYRVATNYCLNELRNRKHRPLVHPTGAEEAPSLHDVERRIVNRDLAARLIEAAHPKVKPVAWLYHVDGMDQEEVARILDLSRRTVATRLAAFATTAQKLLHRSESWA